MQKLLLKTVFFVEGYFSLVHKSIEFYSDISKSKRKKIFCGLDKGKNGFSTVLIAQLGKFIDGDSVSTIRIDDIMKHALDIISKQESSLYSRQFWLNAETMLS